MGKTLAKKVAEDDTEAELDGFRDRVRKTRNRILGELAERDDVLPRGNLHRSDRDLQRHFEQVVSPDDLEFLTRFANMKLREISDEIHRRRVERELRQKAETPSARAQRRQLVEALKAKHAEIEAECAEKIAELQRKMGEARSAYLREEAALAAMDQAAVALRDYAPPSVKQAIRQRRADIKAEHQPKLHDAEHRMRVAEELSRIDLSDQRGWDLAKQAARTHWPELVTAHGLDVDGFRRVVRPLIDELPSLTTEVLRRRAAMQEALAAAEAEIYDDAALYASLNA
jgi:hypothetical protein